MHDIIVIIINLGGELIMDKTATTKLTKIRKDRGN